MSKKGRQPFEIEWPETRAGDDEVSESTLNDLLYGGRYNFKHQPERLKYIGKHNGWHQFEKVGEQGVWCELLDSDLHMIEETDDFNYEHDYDIGN